MTFQEATAVLRERVEALLASGKLAPGRAARVEVPVEPVQPLLWLRTQPAETMIFWADREGTLATAGSGIAHELCWKTSQQAGVVFAAARRVLGEAGGPAAPRYYGGFCFDPHHLDSQWSDFGMCRFVIPRFELSVRGGAAGLACSFVPGEGGGDWKKRLRRELSDLETPAPRPPGRVSAPYAEECWPNRVKWDLMFDGVMQGIHQNRLKKIVLARKTVFRFDERVDPLGLLHRLTRQAANGFPFLFRFRRTGAFVGVSPERLFRREGRRIWSEAVAGTRPVGATPAEDEQSRRDLMESAKDREEHVLVVESIRKRFRGLCRESRSDDSPELMTFGRSHHLISRHDGVLHDEVRDEDVLAALHPTPAVAGSPVLKALYEIKRREHFSRGWYAAPVGTIGPDGCDFSVALRCGLLQDRTLVAFSGAGIVEGSTAAAEWEEIDHKADCFRKILT